MLCPEIPVVVRTTLILFTAQLFWASGVLARDLEQEVDALRDEIAELRRANAGIQERLEQALLALAALRSTTTPETEPASPLDEAIARLGGSRPAARPAPPAPSPGPTGMRLVDVSLSTLMAAGSSTERDPEIDLLQAGAHDPRKRGFTLQQAELSLLGAIDPYFNGEAHLIYSLAPDGESEFELEEAFLTTQALPGGLQVEVGHFFTEFGRLNPTHPHAWLWQDQPIIASRLFGGDGMRAPGIRVGWLTELPWYSELHLGAQNANGDTMVSFLGEDAAVGGRTFVDRTVSRLDDLVWLARWYNAWDPTDDISTAVGLSALFGPNATGDNGQTRVWGADLVVKWRPATQRRGWPFFVFESEIMRRDYEADDDPLNGLSSETLQDWGLYAQGLWGFRPRWAAGLRLEYASGSGASVGGRASDPFRDDRTRISPILAFHPSEYSRLRLQYNFDRADHLARRDTAHSVWLGLEFGLGAHPGHRF